MLAGFGAWASLARSGPTGAAWLVAWVLAPLLVVGLLVAALAAWRMREPGDVVQLPGALGVNLLTVAGWGWLAAAHLAVGWVVVSVVLLLMLVALDTRPRSAAVPPSIGLAT